MPCNSLWCDVPGLAGPLNPASDSEKRGDVAPTANDPMRIAWLRAEIARIEDLLTRGRFTPEAYGLLSDELEAYHAELADLGGLVDPVPTVAGIPLTPSVLVVGAGVLLAIGVYVAAARSPYAR